MKIDVLCAGELLVDFISEAMADSLAEGGAFRPYAGGSPANLATNLQHLGVSSRLIAAVGADAFGEFLRKQLEHNGLDTSQLRTSPRPTTLITVTRSESSPSFEVFRGADSDLSWGQFAELTTLPPRVLHTTCFAMSALPARSHIMRAASALAATTRLSIDVNYAYKVWPDRQRARAVVMHYIRHGALVKMSDDDWLRLMEEELTLANCTAKARSLLAEGASQICFTFGAAGAMAFAGEDVVQLSPKPVKVADSTGAGDSFWAGYLAAYLAGESLRNCLETATKVAAVKLQNIGPLAHALDWKKL